MKREIMREKKKMPLINLPLTLLVQMIARYLYHMVTKKSLRKYDVIGSDIFFSYFPYECTTFSELPSNIRTIGETEIS